VVDIFADLKGLGCCCRCPGKGAGRLVRVWRWIARLFSGLLICEGVRESSDWGDNEGETEWEKVLPFNLGFQLGNFGVVVDISRVRFQYHRNWRFGGILPREPVREF
jgi:hypothetical protein